MKKINLKDVKNAISRDELRAVKGGSGPWCPGRWCGHSAGTFLYHCTTPEGYTWVIRVYNGEICYSSH
jgi:natural product precursor